MPVESCALFDNEMKSWSDKVPGARLVFGGVGKRPVWERALDIAWYVPQKIDELTKPKAGTREFVNQRRYAQWQAMEFLTNLGKVGLPLALNYLGGEKFSLQSLFANLYNPERIALPQALSVKEVARLSLLDGRQGLGYLCNDVSVASLGINKDNFQKVDFNNLSTWGHSELRQQVESLNNFFVSVKSSEGRQKLRAEIVKQANGDQNYLNTRNANLDKLERYIAQNNLPANLSEVQLKAYFISMDYSEQDWQTMTDLVKVWQTQKPISGLQERINQCKIQKPVSREEQKQGQETTASFLLRQTGLENYIDTKTLVEVANTFGVQVTPEELHSSAGKIWYPDTIVPETIYGDSTSVLFPFLLGAVIIRNSKIAQWGIANLGVHFSRKAK